MQVAVISVLSYRPDLILLDEALSGLDATSRDQLMKILPSKTSHDGWNPTIILTSHDFAEIEAFASHIGILKNGQMVYSESMAAIRNRFRRVSFRGAERSDTLRYVQFAGAFAFVFFLNDASLGNFSV